MNKGFVFIDVLIALVILAIISNLLLFSFLRLESLENTIDIVSQKIETNYYKGI